MSYVIFVHRLTTIFLYCAHVKTLFVPYSRSLSGFTMARSPPSARNTNATTSSCHVSQLTSTPSKLLKPLLKRRWRRRLPSKFVRREGTLYRIWMIVGYWTLWISRTLMTYPPRRLQSLQAVCRSTAPSSLRNVGKRNWSVASSYVSRRRKLRCWRLSAL